MDIVQQCIDLSQDQNTTQKQSQKLKNLSSLSKGFGRWSEEECQIYLRTLQFQSSTKKIIKSLKNALPGRIESQLRAHHQKMLKKYGSVQRILTILTHSDIALYEEVGKRLSSIEQKLKNIHFCIEGDTA